MVDNTEENGTIFSEKIYREYVEEKDHIHNERLRGDNETIFEVALSPEADLTRSAEGRKILETIRSFK